MAIKGHKQEKYKMYCGNAKMIQTDSSKSLFSNSKVKNTVVDLIRQIYATYERLT